MGVLETLVQELKAIKEELILLHKKFDEPKISEDDEVWQREGLMEFMDMKYSSMKNLIDMPNFPIFKSGKKEYFLKSEVIKFIREHSYLENSSDTMNNKTKVSPLYKV